MKKIAFILRMYQEKAFHGGGEKFFCNLINRFIKDGYDIHVYCSESDVNADYVKILDEKYDHNDPVTMENFYNKAKDQIKQKNYDYIISENITPPVDITFLHGHSLINRLRKTKNPIETFFYNFRKVKKQRIKYQQKWMEQGYRKIFVVSEVLKRDIVENFGVSEENIAVAAPGVDLPGVQQSSPLNEVPIFGLLAPGFNIKGGFVLLKALAILKKRGYKFKAKIIYPKYKKNLGVKLLIMLNNLKDNVDFLGHQKNGLDDFYKNIDCLVVPSVEDTFNIAALEAMSFCKPVIVSTNAGVYELIKDGENGFIFDMQTNGFKNLAEKLMYFLDNADLYSKLANNSRKTAEEYSWDRTYKKIIEEIAKL